MLFRVNQIDELFSVVWFSLNPVSVQSNGRVFTTANQVDHQRISRDYARYLTSGKTLEDFFDRQIIVCNYSNARAPVQDLWTTSLKRVYNTPVFIGKQRQTRVSYHVIRLEDVSSKYPIQMSTKQLALLHGIETDFEDLLDLYDHHEIAFKFVDIKDGKCFVSNSLPGMRTGNFPEIVVGVKNDQTFWVPSTFTIQERFYCSKFPSKCTYFSTDQRNTNRHEETCTDTTEVKSSQVDFNFLLCRLT